MELNFGGRPRRPWKATNRGLELAEFSVALGEPLEVPFVNLERIRVDILSLWRSTLLSVQVSSFSA